MIKKIQMRFGFLHDFLKGVSVSAFFVSIFLQLSVSLAIADDGLRGLQYGLNRILKQEPLNWTPIRTQGSFCYRS